MKLLALDTETTTFNKGNPFDERNFLVCSSWASSDGTSGCVRGVDGVQDLVDSHDVIIMFNAKFDLHWFRKAGVSLREKPLWDVQVVEFVLSRQTLRFPNLDGCAEKYLNMHKIDVIKSQYWDRGINTDEIPFDILAEYAELDSVLTLRVFQEQEKIMTPAQRRLIRLKCMDTHILAEMEWNGLTYNKELCAERSREIDDQISKITRELSGVYPNVPINFNSGDHLSAFLYGGVVKEDGKEHVGFYKSGEKAGQPKYRNIVIEHQLPRLAEPIRGSALKKEGFYATNEDTLKKLKGRAAIKHIQNILELSKLDKLNGTYYKGLPALEEEMHWPSGVLHGQLNQCVAATGRLSAMKPNQQNFASDMQDVFITRYER